MRRSHRKHTVRGALAAAAFVTLTACPPPAPPAPELPDGVGVAWVRDEYGAPNEFGNYVESYARYQVLDGVRTGPTPPDPTLLPLAPTVGAAYSDVAVPVFPDGTARFGWNGFAGDGITTDVTIGGGFRTYQVTGSGGSCTFSHDLAAEYPTPRTLAAIPSPDGTKLAVYTRVNDPDASTIDTWLSIRNLDAGCTQVALVTYEWSSAFGDFSGERITNPFVVWSPTSSAVLFSLEGAVPGNGARVMRLDATAGSSPTVVLDLGTSTATPTGWSVDDRMVLTYNLLPSGSWPAGASVVATTPVGGGALTKVDVWDLQTLGPQRESHYGYYVPGTSTVVYSDASRTVVNPQGTTVAWPRFRLYDDATGGWAPMPETALPLTWRPLMSGQDVPVIEMLDRFVG